MDKTVKIGCLSRSGAADSHYSACLQSLCQGKTNFTADSAMAVCIKLGLYAELAVTALEIAGFERKNQLFIVTNVSGFGTKVNGKWTGILGLLQKKIIDTSFPTFTDTEERREIADFTKPLLQSSLAFATRMAQQNSGSVQLNPLEVFQPAIWASMVFTGFFLSLFLTFQLQASSHKHGHIFPRAGRLARSFIDTLFLFTGQSEITEVPKKSMARISVASWALCASIISNLYAGLILVNLMKTKIHLPFTDIRSLAQCVKSNQCYIFMPMVENSIASRLINKINLTPAETELSLVLEKHPIRANPAGLEHCFSTEAQYPVYMLPYTLVIGAIQSSNHSTGEFLIIQEGFPDTFSFPTQKRNSLTELLDMASVHVKEFGLLDALFQKYYLSKTHILVDTTPKPVLLQAFYGSFLLFLTGCCLGSVLFWLERLLFGTQLSSTTADNESDHETVSRKYKTCQRKVAKISSLLAVRKNINIEMIMQMEASLNHVVNLLEDCDDST